MNQIENRKKEIEIKKDINLNMLQIIKKSKMKQLKVLVREKH